MAQPTPLCGESDGDEVGLLAEDAQEFVSGGIRTAGAGFPLGEGGLRNAERGGEFSLIEAESAAQAEDELGRGDVFLCSADDDEGAAGRIVGDAAGGAVGEGDFSDVVELRRDVSDGIAMAAVGSDFRKRSDIAVVLLAPADDARKEFGCFFSILFHGVIFLRLLWLGVLRVLGSAWRRRCRVPR